jgi:Protein of unknown function (DUF2842)
MSQQKNWIASRSLAMTRWCNVFMPIRLRKFIGAIALFVLVIVWALVAMALAQMPAIRDNAIISVAYYVIAGLGWVLPALPIVTWMGGRGR